MQLFTEDGTLVVADAFALTRVDPKGKVKNADKVSPTPRAPLSVGGGAVHVTGPYSYQSKLLDTTTLAIASRFQGPRPDAVLPDGSLLRGRAVSGKSELELPAAPVVGAPVELAGASGGRYRQLNTPRLRAGRLAIHTGPEGDVVEVFDVQGDVPRGLFAVKLDGGIGAVVDAWPLANGLALTSWNALERTVEVARLNERGEVLFRAVLPSQGLPAVEGLRVVTQPDLSTVISTPLAAGAAPVSFDLDALTREARARAKAPTSAPDNLGVGLLLAGSGQTWLLPWHAETLLHLEQAVELERRLPAKLLLLRSVLTAWCKTHREDMLSHGLERLLRVSANDKGHVGFTFWAGADPSAPKRDNSQALLKELVEELEKRTAYRVVGYGSEG